MKISIPVLEDTWNSSPMDELEFIIGEAYVTICIKDENERQIAVNKEEFAKVARFCGYK